MNYQLLLECYASGIDIDALEVELLELELSSQIKSITVSSSQGCLEIAPDHICNASFVCNGSIWITCLAAVLDKLNPPAIGTKARGAHVFDVLVSNGYLLAN